MVHQKNLNQQPNPGWRNGLAFELMFLIQTEPGLSQRKIAQRLGISVGRVNFCLRSLADEGVLRPSPLTPTKGSACGGYVLTAKGNAQRAAMACDILPLKLAEYERLKKQIEHLQREIPRDEA